MPSTILDTPRTATRTADEITPRELGELRQMLEQQRAFRVDQLVQLRFPGHPGPFGSANEQVRHSLAAGARSALHDVQHALWRMDEGSYGRCTACGTRLSLARLELLPQAEHCVPCQRASLAERTAA